MPAEIADNTDKKLKFNLPEAKNLSELHKDDEGVKEIVENVIVEADILSNRTDLKQETRDTFKKVVDTALDPKNTHFSITRDRINELATQRAENIQNNELVKESVHIIKKVDRVLSEINNSLEAIKNGLPGEIIYMNNLYDNRKKLIVLQAQIKDRETLKEIEASINKIDHTIEEIINVVFLKIKEPIRQLDDEQDLASKLNNGNYKVLLSIPDFRNGDKYLYNLEIDELKPSDEEVLTDQQSPITRTEFKVGDKIARLKNDNGRSSTYFLSEIEYLNPEIDDTYFIAQEKDGGN